MVQWRLKYIVLTVVLTVAGIINTLCVRWLYYSNFLHIFVQTEFLFIGQFFLLVMYMLAHVCCKAMLKQEPSRDQVEEKTRRDQRIKRLEEQQQQRRDNGAPEDTDIAKELEDLHNPVTHKLNNFLFLPPALFTIVATGCQFIGIVLTYQSSFQMLRCTAILFTALLSVAFLGRSVKKHGWLCILLLVGGLLSIGGGDMKAMTKEVSEKQSNGVIAGDLMIVLSQIIYATRTVYEERYMNKFNVHPLKAVGLEGLFGAICMAMVITPINFINAGATFGITGSGHNLDNVEVAWDTIKEHVEIQWALVGLVVSIAVYNFAGITITKDISATTRMVVDVFQVIPVWIVSLAVGWRIIHVLHFLGFFFIILGLLIYAEIVTCSVVGRFCCCCCRTRPEDLVPERTAPFEVKVEVDEEPVREQEAEANERQPLLAANYQ